MKQVKLTIPDKWSDITIKTYQEYIEIQESNATDKNKIVKSIALLCGTTPTIVKKMSFKDLKEIMEILQNLLDSQPTKMEFKKTFIFKGEKYGFVPDLSNISTGEYIDLETYCKKSIDNLHTIMSILYRKVTNTVGERYAIEEYNPNEFKEELFKDCPMNIALSSLGFFLTLGEKLAKISQQFLKQQEKKQQRA
tara:strand:+ start:526 stop:1107 length:582 start_codon:yes stop_codon:yes gene_type:complete